MNLCGLGVGLFVVRLMFCLVVFVFRNVCQFVLVGGVVIFFGLFGSVVGFDDVFYQWVMYYVYFGEFVLVDVFDLVQYLFGDGEVGGDVMW